MTVLDLTRLLPGGYATLILADLGADVIKIEEPGRGDYIRWTPPLVGETSAAHAALNRNKRSVTIDLKKPEGKTVFKRMVDGSDVVIESFRPGVMDRLGLGWDALAEVNRRLVYCAISGYGQDGPRALEAGHDINYIGYAGALGINGEEGRGPVTPGLQIGDLGGGAMAAVIAILAALRARDVTGSGDFCDISMMDGVVSWLTIHAGEFAATRVPPERGLMHLSGAHPCYRVYPAADGYLSVGALEPQFWSALCTAIGRDDLAGDAFATGTRREEVIAELESLFAQKTRAEWSKELEGLDVCVGPVNTLDEAFADPQARHREMFIEADLGGTPWTYTGNPIKLRNSGAIVTANPPPGLGEHTYDVLAETGLGPDEIEGLRAAGAI
ncbi:MAG TPA: CaiB/BaiF CoA-transferase family protein [Actinomycetota bacterium]|nr:CaiB/BaiF CoA-transferase family protein [Actinomycetota bacterium]